jgi:putative FmdB family regulatory protein
MPTYDYVCKACDHTWEEFQSITARPTKKCPECGKSKAERKIGPGAGIIFKGSGFYITDYRSEGYKKAAESDSKSQSNGQSKSDSKSESKSESKSSSSESSKPAKKSKD